MRGRVQLKGVVLIVLMLVLMLGGGTAWGGDNGLRCPPGTPQC